MRQNWNWCEEAGPSLWVGEEMVAVVKLSNDNATFIATIYGSNARGNSFGIGAFNDMWSAMLATEEVWERLRRPAV